MHSHTAVSAAPFDTSAYGNLAGSGPNSLLETLNAAKAAGAHTTLLNRSNAQILVRQPPTDMARIVAPSIPFDQPAPPVVSAEERAAAIANAVEGWPAAVSQGTTYTVDQPQYPHLSASLPVVTSYARPKVTSMPVESQRRAMYYEAPMQQQQKDSYSAEVETEIPADWQIPNVQMTVRGQKVTLHEALYNRRGIIFGVPGAFTPVCSQRHVPGFRDAMPVLREAVEYVACVAVNDPYVLKAWAKELDIPKDIVMISDWEGKFTEALGLELDASSYHMGVRCRRFCILVSQGTIVWFGLENDAFVDQVALILHRLQLMNEQQLRTVQEIAQSLECATRSDCPNPEKPSAPTMNDHQLMMEKDLDERVSERSGNNDQLPHEESEERTESDMDSLPTGEYVHEAKNEASSSLDGVQADEEDDEITDDDEEEMTTEEEG
eukprot:Gregarina_sp_Poly_1__299@NODE_1074_length_5174_cov_263_109262_g746_i0_p3_GENE_NODE_1074_length_5174_cov_263_109262_g746_i0NODE_1074_length_5174_cov_263_109262_g746_i0_p3_ORF_typecomplete_len436_score76_66Redoxin/PF08534_10/5_2e20AhpCTSA/PF00578_21/2_8e07_NODE_1074_length_5174_cov_263_109262_g746_i037225029